MSNPKKTHDLIRQNEKIVKKSQKHDVNLQKNSTFYFQIGLIICLLTSYGLLEMKFETVLPKETVYKADETDIMDDEPMTAFTVYKPEVVKVQQKKRSTNFEEFIVKENNDPKVIETLEPVVEFTNTNPDIIDPDAMESLVEEPTDYDVDFKKVEIVPIYPGCEKKSTNAARRKCMSEKITKLIQRKFDTSLASELGLKGRQTIQTQFTIDKKGQVTNIKTRAVHPRLEKEADRVINKIPEMTPGKQRDKNVGVIYTLPIKFDIK